MAATFQKENDGSLGSVASAMVNIFAGATESLDGIAGAVPAPTKSDRAKFLRGDGTWAEVIIISEPFTGATSEEDGVEGIVPAPLTTDREKFLKGDGTWAEVNLAAVDNKITTLKNTLYGENGDQTKSISNIVNDAIAQVVANAPSDFDTLKEISDWITTHANSAATMNSNISTLQTDVAKLKQDVQNVTVQTNPSDTSNLSMWIEE